MTESVDTAQRPGPEDASRSQGRLARLSDLRLPWWRLGSLVLLALFLAPARDSALRGDDDWSFDFRGVRLLHHVSLLSQIWTDTKTGLNQGRPEVLGSLTSDPVLEWFDGHPAEYRIYLIALTVLCGWLLFSLVRRLTDSERLGALSVVMFAGALQLHFYHDPLLGYYGSTEIAVAFLLASLLTHMRAMHAERRMWWWVAATVLLFAGACAEQQWLDLLMACHVCLGLVEHPRRRLIATTLPVVLVGLAFFGYGAAEASLQQSEGYSAALGVGSFVDAWVRSLTPPIPTSNRLFSQGYVDDWVDVFPLGGSPTPAEWLAALWRGAVLAAVTLGFCLRPGSRRPTAPSVPRATLRLLAVGVPLWLVSPLLVVVASKYQVDHTWSRGYVETFAQTVGVVLVAAAALVWLREVLQRRRGRVGVWALAGCAAVLFGVAAGVDGFNNIRLIALEQPVRDTRNLLENAAKRGALDAIPQHSTLMFDSADTAWYTGSFGYAPDSAAAILYADSGRLWDVRPSADTVPLNCPATASFPPAPCSPPLHDAWWVRVRATITGGAVIAARLAHPTAADYLRTPATRVIVYVEKSGTTDPPVPPIAGTSVAGTPWSPSRLHFRRIDGGGGWAVYVASVPAGNPPIANSLTDPQSPVDFDALPAPDVLARMFGTKELLP